VLRSLFESEGRFRFRDLFGDLPGFCFFGFLGFRLFCFFGWSFC
jgi:hypothetical protein